MIGKTGVSIKRKISDGDYGSYEFAFWSEEEYATDQERQAVTVKLLKEAKTVMGSEISKVQKGLAMKGKQNA